MLFYFCKIDYNRFTYIFSTYGNSTDDCGPEPLLPPEAGEKRKQIRIFPVGNAISLFYRLTLRL